MLTQRQRISMAIGSVVVAGGALSFYATSDNSICKSDTSASGNSDQALETNEYKTVDLGPVDGSNVDQGTPEENYQRGVIAKGQGDNEAARIYLTSALQSADETTKNDAQRSLDELSATITTEEDEGGFVLPTEVPNYPQDEIAPGDPDENYNNGLEAQSNGDTLEAIRYFKSAVSSDDTLTVERATKFLVYLEYFPTHPESSMLIVPTSNVPVGTTDYAAGSRVTLGEFYTDVPVDSVVTISKTQYLAELIITPKDGSGPTSFLIAIK